MDDALSTTCEAMPALRCELLVPPALARLEPGTRADHPPCILLLDGSLRERSYSRLLALLGTDPRIFGPRGLPVANSVPAPL